MDRLPWRWLQPSGEHDDVQLTNEERIGFRCIVHRLGDDL